MKNPYLSEKEILEIFRKTDLEGHHDFLMDDLVKLASAFVMAACPAIVRTERMMCVDAVRSLNSQVADKLLEIRGRL